VAAAFHASAAAVSLVAVILAATTAVTALLSLLIAWTSVRPRAIPARLAAQTRAAEIIEAGERGRLAGLNAPLPEVRDSIIAARRRIEAEWLRTWEADQLRRLAKEAASAEPSQRPRAQEPQPYSAPFSPGGADLL
jgi:hypothetical protein